MPRYCRINSQVLQNPKQGRPMAGKISSSTSRDLFLMSSARVPGVGIETLLAYVARSLSSCAINAASWVWLISCNLLLHDEQETIPNP